MTENGCHHDGLHIFDLLALVVEARNELFHLLDIGRGNHCLGLEDVTSDAQRARVNMFGTGSQLPFEVLQSLFRGKLDPFYFLRLNVVVESLLLRIQVLL